MASGCSTQQSNIALRNWECANDIELLSSSNSDDIYHYDQKQQQDMLLAKPWSKE